MKPRLIIAPGKEKAILRRHPWIFSGAVKRIDGELQEGDLVDVVDARGQWMATGHYQNESIICKVLSFDTSQIDEDFFRSRLRSAIDYRQRFGFFNLEDTNVFRMIHAEGDYLPGLVADWYNGVLVLQAHSVGMHQLFPLFVDILKEELKPYGLQSIFDKSSSTVPGGCNDGYLWGVEPDEWEITESGNHLLINFFEGQKTGFFVDQRENRRLLEHYSNGRKVLNMFCYTGGFSVYALRGGAQSVDSVDSSAKAVRLTDDNVALNFAPEDGRHRSYAEDAFKFLDNMEPGAYDLIILDPPAFAKHKSALRNALVGYRRLNAKALEKIAPGSILFTFSCSQAVNKEQFRLAVFSAAAQTKRKVRILHQLTQPADHPINIYHPEGEYLKGLVLYVE